MFAPTDPFRSIRFLFYSLTVQVHHAISYRRWAEGLHSHYSW